MFSHPFQGEDSEHPSLPIHARSFWLARRRGGSLTSRCGMRCFPRMVEHRIVFRGGTGQHPPGEVDPGSVLQAVAHAQQVAATAAEFTSHAGSRGSARDAAHDQDQFGRGALRALPGSAAPGVEHPATGAAVVAYGVAGAPWTVR